MDDINKLYLGGGFGSYIDVGDAEYIGLIPHDVVGRTSAIGNCALSGAIMMLLSDEYRETGERLARQSTELSLSSSAFFMDSYIENMSFYDE